MALSLQHEVVSLSEKVVLRAEDVIGWMRAAGGVKWDRGLLGVYCPPTQDTNAPTDAHYTPPISGALDIKEIMREKKLIGECWLFCCCLWWRDVFVMEIVLSASFSCLFKTCYLYCYSD